MAYHKSSRLNIIGISSSALLGLVLFSGGTERLEAKTNAQDLLQLEVAIKSWQQSKTEQMVNSMEKLNEATGSFLGSPTIESRLVWQSAWVTAHDDFLGASILYSPDNFRRIDAWPIEVGFLDNLADYPSSGIVSDGTVEVTSASLGKQHQITAETEVALGFHVLEYYAFERDIKSFGTDAPNYQKRRHLVHLATELLLEDIISFSLSQENEPETSGGYFSLSLLKIQQRLQMMFNEHGTSQDPYFLLLLKIQQRLQLVFSEFSLLEEHSAHNRRSSQNVSTQLRCIAELLNEPVGLNNFLIELSPKDAQTFNQTFLEVQTLMLSKGQGDETTSSRTALLIAFLSQQLEDFMMILTAKR